MAITYTWTITGVKKASKLNGLDDVVTGIKFKYKGVEKCQKNLITILMNLKKEL